VLAIARYTARPRDFWGGEQARIELLPVRARGAGRLGRVLAHRSAVLFFWSKAAKALSTTPSKGVTLAGCFHQVYPAKIVAGARHSATTCLDIKPVIAEFLPRSAVRQPAWSHELMCEYWLKK
jgi:hypothetical protein